MDHPKRSVMTMKNMKNENCDKLILAILQNDNPREVVENLNNHGFYVTVLESSGGFMRKMNSTIMIGVNHEYLDEALQLLKQYGRRTEMQSDIAGIPLTMASVQVPVQKGGVVVFVLDVAQNERY